MRGSRCPGELGNTLRPSARRDRPTEGDSARFRNAALVLSSLGVVATAVLIVVYSKNRGLAVALGLGGLLAGQWWVLEMLLRRAAWMVNEFGS